MSWALPGPETCGVDPAFDDADGTIALIKGEIQADGFVTAGDFYKSLPRDSIPMYIFPEDRRESIKRPTVPCVAEPRRDFPCFQKVPTSIVSGVWFYLAKMDDKALNGRMFKCEQVFSYMDSDTDPDDPGPVVRFALDEEMVSVPLSNCKLA